MLMTKLMQICFLTPFLVTLVFANGKVVAVVDKVGGKVTQLRPGAMTSSTIQATDKIYEDTSLVTGEQSFIRLRMNDQSIMSLGPKSMILVKENVKDPNKKEVNVLGLMKGQMRAQVPVPGTQTKMLIETRSAAMGVRGTDFQIMYSPENNHTGLVTYEGKVALAMVDEHKLTNRGKNQVSDVQVSNVGTGTGSPEVTPVVERLPPPNRTELLNSVLQDKETVEVEAGQYSGTVSRFNRPSLPVKINPGQLNSMAKNFDMVEKKKESDLKPQENLMPVTGIKQIDQKAPPEGIIDEKNGIYAPRSGGFIDTNSGLYIAPSADSDFDLKTGVYLPKDTGTVDSETGQFIPPKGTILDPVKGFVAINSKDKILIAMADTLNKSVSQDVVLSSPYSKETIQQEFRIGLKDSFVKDKVGYRFTSLSQSLDTSNDQTRGDRSFSSKSGSSHFFDWHLASGTSYQPFMTFGMDKIDYTGNRLSDNPEQRSINLLNIGAGVRVFLKHLWTLDARFETKQTLYLIHTGAISGLEKVSIIIGRLEAQGLFWEQEKFALYGKFGGSINPSKTRGDSEVGTGFGINVGGEGRYWFKPVLYFNILAGWEMRKSSLTKSGTQADHDHNTSMIGLGTGYFF